MVSVTELTSYIDEMLDAGSFKDYVVNGLQVEGRKEVRRLVSVVTACRALVEAAVHANADAMLVHHGYFWKGEDPCITGLKRQRLAPLLAHEISLLAYHLPLDAHPEVGNNAQLARVLELTVLGRFGEAPQIAMWGELPRPMAAAAFAHHVAQALGRAPLHISGGSAPIRTFGWCTGAGQKYIVEAVALGLDAYISGEISEQTVHVAREAGIHYFAAGHHATERYGVAALGEHLAQKFKIEHLFIEIDNPA